MYLLHDLSSWSGPCAGRALIIAMICEAPQLAPLVKLEGVTAAVEAQRCDQQRLNGHQGVGPLPYRAARRETVPQKTAIIAALTTSRPLCMACVSTRAGLSSAEVEAVLEAIEGVLLLRRDDGRCRACGIVGPIFSVDLPGPRDVQSSDSPRSLGR